MRICLHRPTRTAIGAFVCLSLVGLTIGHAGPAVGQDTPPAPSDLPAGNNRPIKGSAIPPETFVVPAQATAPELIAFIAKIEKMRPEFDSETEAMKFLAKSRGAIVKAADKILGGQPSEQQEVDALKSKLQAYQYLAMVGNPGAAENGLKLADELKHSKRPELAEVGQVVWFDFKMSALSGLDANQRRSLVDAMAIALKKKPQTFGQMAENLGRMLESLGDGDNAAAAYSAFGEIFSQNLNEDIRNYGEVMKNGAVRRARLLSGDAIKVSGKTVEGAPFDIKQYKGKVVIVDFWATWCGPCLAELPNLKSIYKKYHDRGLEIVGVNLDKNATELGKFLRDNDLPWKTLHNVDPKAADDEKKGFSDPNAEFYGIMGIPTIILIDRKGKVISLDARGEQLATLVDGLVGGPGVYRK